MASVRSTLRRQARAMAVATCATSRAWVRRVRWWSSGNTKTCVLPARRRKAVACRMRSRSRSKQVRQGSGCSGCGRRADGETPVGRRPSARCGRGSRRGPGGRVPSSPPSSLPNACCARSRPVGAPHSCHAVCPVAVTSWWPDACPGPREERDHVDVRIGITQSPKELEVEMPEDAERDKVVAEIEKLLKTGDGVLWLTDKKGRRVGVPVVKVAYVEVGAPASDRRVGFGAP